LLFPSRCQRGSKDYMMIVQVGSVPRGRTSVQEDSTQRSMDRTCGEAPKLTNASRCLGSGANAETRLGRDCSIFGDSRRPRCEMRDGSAGPARRPPLCLNTLGIDRDRPQGGTTSMPWFSPADAVKALLYCREAFVDQWLELVVGEDVGPVLLNPLPNQLAYVERIDTR
jgi:hypothetical protein